MQTQEQAKTRQDFLAAARMLHSIKGSSSCRGAVAFCYGGAISKLLATQMPGLDAAVWFNGNASRPEDMPNIKAELRVVLASNDERINAGWPAYEAVLKQAGTRFALYQPANTQHDFNHDTTPRYDEAAAREA